MPPDPEQPFAPEDEFDERVNPLFARLGVPEYAYAQAIQESIDHVMSVARPALGAPDPRWYCIGPRNVGGRITAIAQDPTNPLILYAGSAHGGLWKTINGGDTWRQLGGRDHNEPIGTIAIPVQSPATLYVGTGSLRADYVGGRGIFKVTVNGDNAVFEALTGIDPAELPPASAGPGRSLRYHRIAVDPDDPTRFWAASQTGLWRVEVPLVPVPAAANTIRITRELPPPIGTDPPGDLPALGTGPAPLPGEFAGWPQFATDVAVGRDPNNPEKVNGLARYLQVFVGIDEVGVFRGRFDRTTGQIAADTWSKRSVPAPSSFNRVRVSVCDGDPRVVYAVFADQTRIPDPTNPPNTKRQNIASAVARSLDGGDSWHQRGQVPIGVNSGRSSAPFTGQANYDLVLEVNPDDRDVLLCDAIDCGLSANGADSSGGAVAFVQLSDWNYYDFGDHAQHADQHAALFDRFDRRRVWVGNDGGISIVPDVRDVRAPAPLRNWRKRSHGIVAGQFQAIGVNANLPFITGGGLQDNGSWVSYGGPTWYRCGWADGAAIGFHRGDPRQMFPAQNGGFRMNTITPAAHPPYVVVPFFAGPNQIVSDVVHDVPTPAGPTAGAMELRTDWRAGSAPFVPTLAEDPGVPGQILVGRNISVGLASWLAPPAAAAWPAAPAAAPVVIPGPVASLSAATRALVPSGAECVSVRFGPAIPASRSRRGSGPTSGRCSFRATPPPRRRHRRPASVSRARRCPRPPAPSTAPPPSPCTRWIRASWPWRRCRTRRRSPSPSPPAARRERSRPATPPSSTTSTRTAPARRWRWPPAPGPSPCRGWRCRSRSTAPARAPSSAATRGTSTPTSR